MATLSEAQIIGIVSLAMILSGAVVVTSISDSYYCQPEDNAKECIRLSDSNITCYTPAGGDRCTGGTWKPLPDNEECVKSTIPETKHIRGIVKTFHNFTDINNVTKQNITSVFISNATGVVGEFVHYENITICKER